MNENSLRERWERLSIQAAIEIPEPEPPAPRTLPEIRAAALRDWAQDKDTRIIFTGYLAELFAEAERQLHDNLDKPLLSNYHLGYRDAVSRLRTDILRWARQANEPSLEEMNNG